MNGTSSCALCGARGPKSLLESARAWRFWTRPDGACPACVQEELLRTLLSEGDGALHAAVQTLWPLDAEAAFGALPTPLRLHADPRYRGRCTTLALIDSAFHPHADLVNPHNRIRAWADAGSGPVAAIHFAPDDVPVWPGSHDASGLHWHGTMTSVVAAGNGFLSHGLYRGLASEADVVLVQVRDAEGRITPAAIERALAWLLEHGPALGVRAINLSVAASALPPDRNPVDDLVASLVERGIVVIAAAGNAGERRLVPPATAPDAITVGGLDDRNSFDHADTALWHSNYGEDRYGAPKPEVVAPSIWVAAPVLPGTDIAAEAAALFERRRTGDRSVDPRVDSLKLITPHYQHVDGTSFAAPIVTSVVACMLEASPALRPSIVKQLLQRSASFVPGATRDRQGAGAIEAGRAVAFAVREAHTALRASPEIGPDGVHVALHDHDACAVRVFGSWNGWSEPGIPCTSSEPGTWQSEPLRLMPGRHRYKFLIDEERWIDDPANPWKEPDGLGGFNSVLTTTG
ncbi:MAG: S8 family serine peptidase [Gemmatimonadetes bacterium]|nr:S8 family serine peptidase [Gemmatimonadota bacterium]